MSSTPPERHPLEAVFLENLGRIDRITAALLRRNGVRGEDAADLSAWVRLRLVEDDYAILRKFRGESSIGSFLTVVIAGLLRDERVHRRGRWRPSSAAQRHGALAVRLEALVHLYSFQLAQAGELLRTTGETDLSDRSLAMLLADLPRRAPMRPREVGGDALLAIPEPGSAESALDAQYRGVMRERARRTLAGAIDCLPVQDRLMLWMLFMMGMRIADIARGLGVEQKPLYKRLPGVLLTLRERLLEEGVTRQEVQDLIENQAV